VEHYKLPQWYVSNRAKIEHNLTSKTFKRIAGKFPSPCGNFILIIEEYEKSNGRWSYTYHRGIVYSLIDRKEVAILNSNANKFWHCWVKQGDKLYLLCNEDLQGYTIVDVGEGIVYTYIDPKAKTGWGFSWKEVAPSPDGRFLAVQGDYMEATREVALYDLSNINLPLKKVKRLDANLKNEYLVLKGWKGEKVIMEHMNRGEPTTVEVGV